MNNKIRALLAFGIPFLAVGFAPIPKLPEKLDVLGMIHHIYANNNGINNENQKIVGNMKQISDLAGKTVSIGGHLNELNAGLKEQDSSLAHLNELSKKQVELSDSLHNLAGTLSTDLKNVKQSSASQDSSVQQMLDSASSLSRLAKEIADVNSTIANKLERAKNTTAEVESEMP